MTKKNQPTKIEKLNINLFPPETVNEKNYRKKRNDYISEYEEYIKGKGLFSIGHFEKRPDIGEAKWNEMFPNEYDDWRNEQRILTTTGNQNIINKINELIEAVNKIQDKKPTKR